MDCGIATLLMTLNDPVLRNRMQQQKRDSFASLAFCHSQHWPAALALVCHNRNVARLALSCRRITHADGVQRRKMRSAPAKKRKWKRRVSTPNASLIMVVDATTSLSFSTSATTRRGRGARRLQLYRRHGCCFAASRTRHVQSRKQLHRDARTTAIIILSDKLR